MKTPFLFLILLQLVKLNGQTFSINGYSTDSLYVGTENILKYEAGNCQDISFQIEPKVQFEQNGCEVNIHPFGKTVYQVYVYQADSLIDQFKLYSTRITLRLALLCEGNILTEAQYLSASLIKKAIGIKPIINCPWERASCAVSTFRFIIESKSGDIFSEEVNSWQLTENMKKYLSLASKGDKIILDNITVRCPGDGQSIYRYLEFYVE